MSDFILKIVFKQPFNSNDLVLKSKYGTFASTVGIVCNIFLFTFKLIVGLIANSITIISDGLNNLSDCASCLVGIWGYKMAAKPADKDHPFGHGRAEYVATFVIAVFILIVAYECATGSVEKILHPEELNVSIVTTVVLIGSILVKFWMGGFYKKIGTMIDNSTLMASSQDSYNDTVITLGSLVASIGSLFVDIPLDGIMGLIISLFIGYSAINLLKETIDELIGQTPDPLLMKSISDYLCENEYILGVHDVMMHYYGNEIYASLHVEFNSELSVLKIHDVVDNLENEVHDRFNVHLTIHMDPVELNNPKVNYYKQLLTEYLTSLNKDISMHDFRVVSGPSHDNCVFDLSISFEEDLDTDQLTNDIQDYMNQHRETKDQVVHCVIQYDRH